MFLCHQTWLNISVLNMFIWGDKQEYFVCHLGLRVSLRNNLEIWTGCFPFCSLCRPVWTSFTEHGVRKGWQWPHPGGQILSSGTFCCCWDSVPCAPVSSKTACVVRTSMHFWSSCLYLPCDGNRGMDLVQPSLWIWMTLETIPPASISFQYQGCFLHTNFPLTENRMKFLGKLFPWWSTHLPLAFRVWQHQERVQASLSYIADFRLG